MTYRIMKHIVARMLKKGQSALKPVFCSVRQPLNAGVLLLRGVGVPLIMLCLVLFVNAPLDLPAATISILTDSLNRITNITYSTGGSISYSYDKNGNRVTLSSIAHTTGADTNAPSIPLDLLASALSVSQITLKWSPAFDSGGSGLAGYKVFRNGIFVGASTSTNYVSIGLSPNTQYCFTVAAYDNATNTSLPSVQSCAMTYILSQPVLVLASQNPASGIEFSFNSVSGANYRVQTSSDLTFWSDLTNLLGDGSVFTFLYPSVTNSAQFFRIVSP